jgi:hypothetical protein
MGEMRPFAPASHHGCRVHKFEMTQAMPCEGRYPCLVGALETQVRLRSLTLTQHHFESGVDGDQERRAAFRFLSQALES